MNSGGAAAGGNPQIAMVTGSFPPRVCGIADYTSLLADSLRAREVRVGIWTGCGEAEAQRYIHPIVPAWNDAGVRALAAALVLARPTVVHLQYERSLYEPSPAICRLLPRLLRRAGIPLVTTFHSLDGPSAWGAAHRIALLPLLRGSRDIVVCSQRQLNALRRLPGVIGERTTLIPVGSTIPVTHTRCERTRNEPLRLVYFGFVWRGRSIELLLKTLKALVSGGISATLEVMGGIRDAAYQAYLTGLAGKLGIADRVRFRGALPAGDISRALAEADIVLLPFARGASTGRTTLMAALAHGAPVVTMGAPDNLSPLFRDGRNMRITPIGDETAFTNAVRDLSSDDALRRQLSEGALQLSESFSWAQIAQQILALSTYQDLVNGK